MKGVGTGRLVAVGLLLFPTVGQGLQGALGLEYDDNPFAAPANRRAGWVSRLYLGSSNRLLERAWGELRLRYQGGVKRFWRAEEAAASPGEVVAGHVELEGMIQLHRRLALTWTNELKIKSAARLSREPSYLHGGVQAGVQAGLGRGFTGALRYHGGRDEARSRDLADVGLRALGLELGWAPSRKAQGRLVLSWGWLDYGRPVLRREPDGSLTVGPGEQADQRREVLAGFQFYRGMLADVSYTYVHNRSNSYGYGFRAHQGQLLLSRPLAWGVDGQFYLTLQRRRYAGNQGLAGLREEYAQTLFSLRMSRRLGPRYGVSCEYRHARNGDQGSEGFYRKNAYSLSLDLSL